MQVVVVTEVVGSSDGVAESTGADVCDVLSCTTGDGVVESTGEDVGFFISGTTVDVVKPTVADVDIVLSSTTADDVVELTEAGVVDLVSDAAGNGVVESNGMLVGTADGVVPEGTDVGVVVFGTISDNIDEADEPCLGVVVLDR